MIAMVGLGSKVPTAMTIARCPAAACMWRPRSAKLFAAFLFAALRDPVFDPLHPWRLHLSRRAGTRDQVLHPAPNLLGIERLFQQLAPSRRWHGCRSP